MQTLVSKDETINFRSYAPLEKIYMHYGNMLYGYLFRAIGDHRKTEDYLIEIFTSISSELGNLDLENVYTWSAILKHTRKKLSFFSTYSVNKTNPLFSYLSDEQREVFFASYYGTKTLEEVATALNKPQEYVRKTLRIALATISTNNGY